MCAPIIQDNIRQQFGYYYPVPDPYSYGPKAYTFAKFNKIFVRIVSSTVLQTRVTRETDRQTDKSNHQQTNRGKNNGHNLLGEGNSHTNRTAHQTNTTTNKSEPFQQHS